MFLALGVGAWSAAMFHFMTHAFFKALLFLSAGAVIYSLHHEHDMRRMGGLRTALPLTFWTFVAGAASLAALPLVTAGFYSKDLILLRAWSDPVAGPWLWAAGFVGALLTAVYSFRVVVIAFLGEPHTPIGHRPGLAMQLPLLVLAVAAVVGGFVETPAQFGDIKLFSSVLQMVLPAPRPEDMAHSTELVLSALAMAAGIGGSMAAFLLYRSPQRNVTSAAGIRGVITRGWDFDTLYERLFVRPFTTLARVNRRDVVDAIYTLLARLAQWMHGGLSRTQSGLMRHYAAGLALGAIVLIALVMR
jgi:NADH-quinone oxidoreductase subunit L